MSRLVFLSVFIPPYMCFSDGSSFVFSRNTDDKPRSTDTKTKPRVLVLGMAYVSESYAKTAEDKQMSGVRDRKRILALESCEYDVYSAAKLESAAANGSYERGRHFSVTYGRLAARDICQSYSGEGFDLVLLDYVRFPKGLCFISVLLSSHHLSLLNCSDCCLLGYMEKVYNKNVFSEFLPDLLRKGVLKPTTKIFVPNKLGWEQLPNLLSQTYDYGQLSFCCVLFQFLFETF
jgi:hypothetical protein